MSGDTPPLLAPLLTCDQALSRYREILGLGPEEASACEALRSIIELTDGLPATIEEIARACMQLDVWAVRARIEHDMGLELFDVSAWGVERSQSSMAAQRLLDVASVCHPAYITPQMLEELYDAPVRGPLEELLEMGLLVEHSSGYRVRWVTRLLVDPAACGELAARHARHMRSCVEAGHGSLSSVHIRMNCKHAISWSVEHDLELAAHLILLTDMYEHQLYTNEERTRILGHIIACWPHSKTSDLFCQLLLSQGRCHRFEMAFTQSLSFLERARAIRFGQAHTALDIHISSSLAATLYYLGDMVRVESICRYALAQVEDVARDIETLQLLQLLGISLLRRGRIEQGIEALEESLELAPDSATVRSNIAVIYSQHGHAELAHRHLERGLELVKPGTWTELNLLNNSIVLDLYLERREQAARRLERIEALYEELGSKKLYRSLSLFVRAFYLFMQDHLLQAYHASSQSLKLEPGRLDARLLRAVVSCYMGEEQEVKLDLDRLSDHAMMSSGTRRYMKCVEMFSRVVHRKSDELDELRGELEGWRELAQSCLTQLFFRELEGRVAHLVDPEHTLQVTPSMQHVRVGQHEEAIDLRRSSVTRALLEVLVKQHQQQPGCVCDIETLFEAAWPGQHWNPSARVRLHTAIHRLRDRILGDLLVTHADTGYSLVLTCRVELHQSATLKNS